MQPVITDIYTELTNAKRVVYFNSGKTELVVRCPYCGDSIKDATHAHLFIQVAEPHYFYCQRCETKGFLNSDLIKDIEVSDDIGRDLDRNLKTFLKNTNKTSSSINTFKKNKKLVFPKYNFNSSSFIKRLDYFTKRLGIQEITRLELLGYKIIGNFLDFLTINNLTHLLDNPKFYGLTKNIDDRAIGFLSYDNNYIVFRFIDHSFKYRYLNLSLNYPYDIGNKSYCIKNNIDIFEPDIELVLAEGIFDIISVYRNFYSGMDNSKKLFFAVAGKSFNLVPNLINRMGFLNLNLSIYSDNGITVNNYKYKMNTERYNSVIVSYNIFDGEKDFGVPKEKITRKSLKIQ